MGSGQIIKLECELDPDDHLTVTPKARDLKDYGPSLEVSVSETTIGKATVDLDMDKASALAAVLIAWVNQHTPEYEPQHAEIPGQTTVDEALVAVSVAP